MSIESERKRVIHLKEELAKLKTSYAKEEAKVAPLKKKILSAESAIHRTKSLSVIKSKQHIIDTCNKNLADISKKCASLQKKIGAKERELATAEKKLSNSDAKETRRQLEATDKRFAEVDETLLSHAIAQNDIRNEIDELKALPKEITILFLASNPNINSNNYLKLDEEARNIQEKIRLSEYRDTIKFETRWAVRVGDVLQAINETNPTIIHFSGHGCNTGELVFQNPNGSPKFVSAEAISKTISTVSDTVKLVFFNACHSSIQAEKIVESIDTAIGMNDAINDNAACIFAARFYSSIGFGLSVKQSFNQAIAELLLEGVNGHQTPELYENDCISADDLYLVAKQSTLTTKSCP